ncbi:MAG: indole-3-glycerol-phosphate synthase [Hadesarchaea archaeon]|nr:indole-3-glycerol-phosphate synthase [Hadesarchaea archaeon]
MTILDEIVECTQKRVEKRAKLHPINEMELDSYSKRSLRESIESASRVPVITEIKRTSPSQGNINSELNLVQITKQMTKGQSAGISVLTEPEYFNGRLDFLSIARGATDLPVLRKDFIVDKYQLYESVEAKSDAVLLIADVLGDSLKEFVENSKELGLESLVEISSEDQIDYVSSIEPDLIGINNRDLEKMTIDFSRTKKLANQIKNDCPIVSESGIKKASDIISMLEAGADAVLVGTSIMKSNKIKEKVRELTQARE